MNLMETIKDGKWIVENKKEVLPKIIINGWKVLESYRKQNSKYLHNELGDDDYFEALVWLKKIYDKDKKLFNEIKEKIYYLLMSNKDILVKRS